MFDRKEDGRRDRVVLVGMNEELEHEIRLQLKHFAYFVERVESFDRVSLAAEDGIRAILFDVADSADTGLGVGAEVRQRLVEAAIPIVVLSNCDDLTLRLAAVRMGAVAYLLKPLDYPLLIDTLDQVTGRRYLEPFRVLVVESDAEQADECKAALEKAGMQVVTLHDPFKTLEVMAEFNPELVLTELNLPGVLGTDLAAVIRQKQTYISVPIVFLSAETRVDYQIEAMKRADNFLTKPIDPEFLVAAVSSRAERYRMLRALMTRDSLTGLLNHTNTKDRLAVEVRRAIRLGSNLVVAMIDIDRFKQVNDTRGHQAGDRVIKRLARLLRERLRRTDVLGRYGGDEFVVVLVDTSVDAARRVLDQVRQDFASLGHQTEGGEPEVTLSIGLACLAQHPESGLLLEAADQALYRAKRRGGNQVVVGSRRQVTITN